MLILIINFKDKNRFGSLDTVMYRGVTVARITPKSIYVFKVVE